MTVLSLSLCFTLIACDNGVDKKHEHQHIFSEEWLHDANSHWHAAVCHNGVTSQPEEHTFIDDKCYVCGYNKLTESTSDTKREAGLTCKNYLSDDTKILISVANAITDLQVYTKDHKPIIAIDSHALENNKRVKKVTIGSNVLTIGEAAFKGCAALEEVIIENAAISIQEEAFADCPKLEKISVGNSVISIANNAFKGCAALKEVHIADADSWCNIIFANESANPLTIAHELYLDGEPLKNVVLTDAVKKIGDYAFDSCSTIESVEMSGSIVSIGTDAFKDCTKINKVNYTGNIADWCGMFMYNQYSNPLYYAKALHINNVEVTEVDIPEGVQSICDYAFVSCSNIKKISIPKSVLLIGDGILFNCDTANLSEVNFNGSEEEWKSIGLGLKNDNWHEKLSYKA